MTTGLDTFTAWLDTLPPVEQARVLADVLDRRNAPTLSARRVAAIHTATRTSTRADVARELGVSVPMVVRAIGTHNRNTSPEGATP
jgi:hypothetical protein